MFQLRKIRRVTCIIYYFFFVKQKTAYEMRISDWSSDVCSSDLLPSDRFLFAGFLPNKAKARADTIAEFAGLRASLVFYESGPRLAATLAALAEGPGNRQAAVAREITKLYEECVTGPLAELATRYADAPPTEIGRAHV